MIRSILKLIRWPNLVMVALTMCFVRYFLVRPILDMSELHLQVAYPDFFFLVLSVLFITAGGYIINDYFDTKIDIVNKPGEMIIGKVWSRKAAMTLYIILNAVGVAGGSYVAFKTELPKLGLIFPLTAGILWFYSVSYKRTFLLGNMIVALLSSVVPVMAAIFEKNMYVNFLFIAGYSLFAFLLTMIREIIKDIEDKEGDTEEGCKTIPIVLGVKGAKIIAIFFSFITIAFIAYIQRKQFLSEDKISFWYFTIALQLPMVILTILTAMAGEKKGFHRLSTFTKLIMLAGILSMPIFYYSLLK